MTSDADFVAIILAAGEGTRMKSNLAKVLHAVHGKTMIRYVVDAVRDVGPSRIIVIVGHQAEAVKRELENDSVEFVLQSERLGTGHAAQMAEPLLDGYRGTIVVLNGDTPLLRPATLFRFLRFHKAEGAVATVLTAVVDDPAGYGRIIRDGNGALLRIVEQKDAAGEERNVREINSGIFCFESTDLFSALTKVDRRNVQGEYYITDVMEILRSESKHVTAYRCDQKEEVLGINDQDQLKAAERLMTDNG